VLKEDDPLLKESLQFRSYGYVAIEKYELAIADCKKVQKQKILQETAYNKLLAKGILRMDHEDFLMASKYFAKAWKLFPTNKDSYCLQVISIVRSYTYSLDGYNIDQQIKFDKVMETKRFIDKAIRNCQAKNEPSLYFFRGLLYFHLHRFYDAIQDFNLAI
jgi:tetratricopeptide (TPR) repeat protein